VGEQCDGGAYCTASCNFPSIDPGCCQGGIPGCAAALGFPFISTMQGYCLDHGYTTAVPGGVCSGGGTCDILPLQPVPLCCRSILDGTCSNDGIVSDTGQLWRFSNACYGSDLAHQTIAPATCSPAGICIPG